MSNAPKKEEHYFKMGWNKGTNAKFAVCKFSIMSALLNLQNQILFFQLIYSVAG